MAKRRDIIDLAIVACAPMDIDSIPINFLASIPKNSFEKNTISHRSAA